MYTLTGYRMESVYTPKFNEDGSEELFEGTWEEGEVEAFKLVDIIGYSFGTNSVAVQYEDGSAEVRFTNILTRITLSAPVRAEEEEPERAVPDNVVVLAPSNNTVQ